MAYNIHPPLTDFPLPCLIFLVIFEALSLRYEWARKPAWIALAASMITIGAAFLSGYQGNEFVSAASNVPDDAIARHHALGRGLLFLSFGLFGLKLALSVARYGRLFFGLLYAAALAGAIVLTGWTAYAGGELVFRFGAGVQRISAVLEQ